MIEFAKTVASLDFGILWYGKLALGILGVTVVLTIAYHLYYPRAARPFPALRLLIAGIFAAMAVQYIPILYFENNAVGSWWEIAIQSAYRALRIFLVDGEWEKTAAVLAGMTQGGMKTAYTAICLGELIGTPILTAGFLLSFFSGLTARLRYMFSWFCPTFVFSKLNVQSMALAKTVREKHRLFATIVFADVFFEHGDDGYELMCEAKDIRAICLKQDIVHLRLGYGLWKNVTLFVIGDDESENLAQAIALTEKHKNRRHTAIYVYATSVGSGYIMDSLNKGDRLIPRRLRRRILRSKKPIFEIMNDGIYEHNLYPLKSGFNISRVDGVYNIVLDTFCKAKIFELCDAARTDRVISLLIVGMGEYGKQILKTALWFCQMDGYKLEINVVDSGRDKNGTKRDIEEVLRQECPEIISKNPCTTDGDANYDIRFYKNIDCFTAAFDRLFTDPTFAPRLERTLMAFAALGNDDKNIEAAILLRKLFDRLHGVDNARCKAVKNAPDSDLPRIYAVVYDDQKARNLNVNKRETEDSYLVDYKGTPYHIQFIGNLSSHYSYSSLSALSETEWKAFKYHTNWAGIEQTIHDGIEAAGISACPQNNGPLREDILQQEKVTAPSEIAWDNGYLAVLSEKEEKAIDEKKGLSDKRKQAIKEKTLLRKQRTALLEDIEKYMRFEYYKYSSIAKAVHKDMVAVAFKETLRCEGPLREVQTEKGVTKKEQNPLCRCKNCEQRRKSEHMRWNAYMRVSGYRYGNPRADRALIHPNLCLWQELPLRTKFKD